MKKIYLAIILSTIALSYISGCASMQDIYNNPEFKSDYIIQKNMEYYTKLLKLDEKQSVQLIDIMASWFRKVETIREKYKEDADPMLDKAIAAGVSASWTEIASMVQNILNPTQKKIFKKFNYYYKRTSLYLVKLVLTDEQRDKLNDIIKNMPKGRRSMHASRPSGGPGQGPPMERSGGKGFGMKSGGGDFGRKSDLKDMGNLIRFNPDELDPETKILLILTSNQRLLYNDLIRQREEYEDNDSVSFRDDHRGRSGMGGRPGGGKFGPGI